MGNQGRGMGESEGKTDGRKKLTREKGKGEGGDGWIGRWMDGWE